MAPPFAPSTQAGALDDHHNQIASALVMTIVERLNGGAVVVHPTHNLQREGVSGEGVGSRRRFIGKGHWKPSEDVKLRELVALHGPKNWNTISTQLPGRSGKSCRLRWVNQLDPRINKTAFSNEEDDILMAAHAAFGNQWSKIARFFPGRTDNAVKNHWHVLNAQRRKNLTGAGAGSSSSATASARTNGSSGSTVTLQGKSTVTGEGTTLSCMNTPRSVLRKEEIKGAFAVVGGGSYTAKAGSYVPLMAQFSFINPSSSMGFFENSNSNTVTSHITATTSALSPSSPPPPRFINFLGVGE